MAQWCREVVAEAEDIVAIEIPCYARETTMYV